MASADTSCSATDQVQEFPEGKAELVDIGGGMVGKTRSSPRVEVCREHVRPIAERTGRSFQASRSSVSGTLHMVISEPGSEFDTVPRRRRPCLAAATPSVVGDGAVVVVD